MANLYIRPYTTIKTIIKSNENLKNILINKFGSFPIVLNKKTIPELKNLGSEYLTENDIFQKIINAINNLEIIELWII